MADTCTHKDDHEVADQSWKAGTADSNDTSVGCSFSASGACFTDRKLAAIRAYHEWIPIRQVDPDDKLRIWRNFQIGKLLVCWFSFLGLCEIMVSDPMMYRISRCWTLVSHYRELSSRSF